MPPPTVAEQIAAIDRFIGLPLSGVASPVAMSDLTVHHRGDNAFQAFNQLVDECRDEQALIVISAWGFRPDTPIGPGGVSIMDTLTAAAGRGVKVRALFNHFPTIDAPILGAEIPVFPGSNAGAVALVRGLPGGAAIHDGRALHHSLASVGLPTIPGFGPVQIGVHHMKVWIVWTGSRLVAWCGGVDFDPNRNGPTRWHDVMAQLEGSAAEQVYGVIRDRWNEHPARPPAVTLPLLSALGTSGSGDRTRVVATYGDPTAHAGLNGSPYTFAPTGSTAIRQLIQNMLRQSRRFVYIEDQYLVDEQTGKDIAAEMSHIEAVIIVIPGTEGVNGELHQAFRRRRELLAHLAPHMSKIAVVINTKNFVHAKVWIFDDIVMLVSSANINRRGFEHDSELGVAFGSVTDITKVSEIRQRLWTVHLGPHAPAPGTDPVATLPVWKAPPAGTSIAMYDPAVGVDPHPLPIELLPLMNADQFWQRIVDPPGR